MDLSKLLNPQQLEAAQATEGPVLILAGAGSSGMPTYQELAAVADLELVMVCFYRVCDDAFLWTSIDIR